MEIKIGDEVEIIGIVPFSRRDSRNLHSWYGQYIGTKGVVEVIRTKHGEPYYFLDHLVFSYGWRRCELRLVNKQLQFNFMEA